ncbi:MAG: ABC transporter ATP-binding protein, partial [Pseudomonadota bacterium]|nr:ABC transporter ATP-binding protein [Pseudomonadota bacterium]
NNLSFNKNIRFDDVTFGYEKNKTIIKNISFTINKGDFIGVVGSTGAGKTTIVDLLLGLYVPTQGSIYIDENRINHINFNLKSLVGYVSQNISLVNDTIAKNIAFGINDNEIDYELINEVIKKSQLADLVNKLDEGVMTSIGDKGVKLSGGQRQRIGIARALYFNPKVLVLDEATNELDIHTEEMIFNNIKEENPDITILMITHRLTSLKLCSEVLLLNKSKISRLEINNEDHLKKINNLIKLSYQNE